MAGIMFPGAATSNAVGGVIQGVKDAQEIERNDLAIKQLKEDQDYRAMLRDARGALSSFVGSNGVNTEALKQFYNKHNPAPQDGGISELSRNDDGSYRLVTGSGDTKNFKNMDDVGMTFFTMVQPEMWVKAAFERNKKPKVHAANTADGGITTFYDDDGNIKHTIHNPKDPKSNTDKYNPQTAYENIRRTLFMQMGGQLDTLGNVIKPVDNPEKFNAYLEESQRIERNNPGKYAPGEITADVMARGKPYVGRTQAEEQARKEANDKAGYFTTDSHDFPETGGDREKWIKGRADEIARASSPAAGGGLGLTPTPPGGLGNTPATKPAAPATAAKKAPPLPSGFDKNMVYGVNTLLKGTSVQAFSKRMKELGYDDARIQSVIQFADQVRNSQ